MTIAQHDLGQKLAALDSANRIRCRRAEVRRAIGSLPPRESRRRAVEVLSDPEPACEGMTAYHLLTACRRLGPKAAMSILVRSSVPQHKRLSEMTDRQRAAVTDRLLRDSCQVAPILPAFAGTRGER